MGLLKRLTGESAPSQDDLQRQAAAEIDQLIGSSQRPPSDEWTSNGQAAPEKSPDADNQPA